jgi:hypothetical protein
VQVSEHRHLLCQEAAYLSHVCLQKLAARQAISPRVRNAIVELSPQCHAIFGNENPALEF